MGRKSLAVMAEGPQLRMVLWLSAPVILSLLVQGLYNIVDSIFLARLGEDVLSAMSLAFVFQNLCSAFFSGIATGMNSVVSRCIGAGEEDKAKSYIVAGLATQFALCICVALIGIFAIDFYFQSSTSSQSVIASGVDYLRPLLLFSVLPCMQITMERLLQSVGLGKYMLYSQFLGTLVNVVLDPILIFGLFGLPSLGVTGAAIATLVGQGSAAAMATYFNLKKNRVFLSVQTESRRLSGKYVKEICMIGLPISSVGIAGSIGNYYMNIVLIDYLTTANAAFGVYTKLQEVALMPTQGFGAGLVTQIAYFYGRRDLEKIRRSLLSGMALIEVWSASCFVAFFFFPTLLMQPFMPTEQMIEIGVPCFRIIGTTYLVSGAMLAVNSFFQAIGKSLFTIAVSVSRQILVRIPVAAFLAQFGNIDLIWWCWPVSEISSDAVSLAFFFYAYKKLRLELKKVANG